MNKETQYQKTLERILTYQKGIIGDEDKQKSKNRNPRKELQLFIDILYKVNLILRNMANGFVYESNDDLETRLWFSYYAGILKSLEKKLSKHKKI